MTVTSSLVTRLHFDARNASNESAALHSALRLGLLDAVVDAGEGGIDEVALAEQLGASPRGVRSLVELLLGMGLFRREHLRCVFATPALEGPLRDPVVKAELRESTRYFGPVGRLADAVRSGGEPALVDRLRRVLLQPPPPFDAPALALWERFAASYLRTGVLLAAGRLGLFDAAASGAPVAETAARLGASVERLELMKALLERMGLFAPSTSGQALRLSEEAQPIFGDEKGRAYMVRSFEVSGRYWEALTRLDETVLHERYVLDLKDAATSAEFYADNSSQISAVFASHFRLARQAASAISAVQEVSEVLDIGTGSGVWGSAFAAAFPKAQVTYFDQESVLPQVRGNLERLKVLPRARLVPGNLFVQEFGEGLYDIVILPQVLNVLTPRDVPDLVRRAARALKPSGVLTIAEYVLTDDRDGPLDHLYFNFRRFITNEGDLLSFPEYREVLRQVGLTQARCFPLMTQEIILASRDGVALPQTLAAPAARSR
jgi:ubiquinone/menaquinone biosynthesis C-methylase UbiE